ncbi:MAG: 50S ribosomal protein L25 [Bacteroidales bacterium]|nr:50S ribosomal protein L25 [Bacteroidales bacterium]MDD4210085.1 50S ribosomal protein L25 [Bacteroidales bacterium]
MKSVSISGSLRENVGKKDAKAKRKEGLTPAVLYGSGKQQHLYVEEKTIEKVIYSPEVKYIELSINDKKHNAIIQELQFHPVTEKLLHVDFLEYTEGKPITIEIPILVEGVSPGVLNGGKLSKKARKVKVKGLLENIPENIKVNISNLQISDNILVKDINTDNYQIIENPAKLLVTILSSRNVEIVDSETTEETAEQQ